MKDSELKGILQQSLQQEVQPERLEECITHCTEIMREQRYTAEETRTGFFQYLSDVFRFEGIPIFGLQAITLFLVCLIISSMANVPEYIPELMPLFALAVLPTFYKGQLYKMSEIEAVTRASGAQIILAKLILAGAANLVCMTVLISLEVHLHNPYREIGRLVLYCLVPYLVCMVSMLRLIRLRIKDNIKICTVFVFSSCVCWGVLARTLPWLYEASAFGIWIVAFLVFTAFFIKEIYFIILTRREGKIYGTIA